MLQQLYKREQSHVSYMCINIVFNAMINRLLEGWWRNLRWRGAFSEESLKLKFPEAAPFRSGRAKASLGLVDL